MKHTLLIPLLAGSAVLAAVNTRLTANDCLTMNVSPRQALAPVNLRIHFRIEPHTDNRALVVVADSSEFYRSSEIPLEGDRAPKVLSIQFPNVPTGEYEIKGVLLNAMGRERATVAQTARVLSVGEAQ